MIRHDAKGEALLIFQNKRLHSVLRSSALVDTEFIHSYSFKRSRNPSYSCQCNEHNIRRTLATCHPFATNDAEAITPSAFRIRH